MLHKIVDIRFLSHQLAHHLNSATGPDGVISLDATRKKLQKCSEDQLLSYFVAHFRTKTKVKKQSPEMIADRLFTWCHEGFSEKDERINIKLIRTLLFVMFAWATPLHLKTHRRAVSIWKLICTCMTINAFVDVQYKAQRKPQFRMLLRMFPVMVQYALLQKDYHVAEFHEYLQCVQQSIWHAHRINHEACTYIMWNRYQSAWYIGKCNILRSEKSMNMPGYSHRCYEHVRDSHCFQQQQERRYRIWRNAMISDQCCIITAWSSEVKIHHYEQLAIREFQAPIQERVKQHSKRPCRTRSWQHQRTKLTLEAELTINMHHRIHEKATKDDSFQSFDDICKEQKRTSGRSQKRITIMAHTLQFCTWLVAYLGQRGARLNYKLAWAASSTRHLILACWVHTLRSPRHIASRVQSKLERFLLSGDIVNPRSFSFQIPSEDKRTSAAFKRMINSLLLNLRKTLGNDIATFFTHKTRIVKGKAPRMHEFLNCHIKASREFRLGDLPQLGQADIVKYDKFEDCLASKLYWDITVPCSRHHLIKSIHQQFHDWLLFARIRTFYPCLDSIIRNVPLPFEAIPPLHPIKRCKLTEPHQVAPLADKDPKRRIFMDRIGYLHRLREGFIHDTQHYTHMKTLTPDDIAAHRERITRQYLPPKYWNHISFGVEHVPYAYHNF